jgi:phosphoglycerate kinase
MSIRWVDELPLAGKTVFCRVDFNVPLDEQQRVTDDTRIRAAMPTLRHILEAGARLVCASHLGRPKGQVVESLRMEPVGARLAELLGADHRVLVTDEPAGDGARKVVADMREGDVVLLENLRFNPGEKSNDEAFARALASMVDGFVCDAFGAVHRAHASIVGLPPLVSFYGGGFLIKKELAALSRLRGEVERPYAALLGGAKVSTKIGVMEDLLDRVDLLLVGGAMANTLIKANGGEVGASLVEDDLLQTARDLLQKAAQKGVDLLLPVDALAAQSLDAAEGQVAEATKIPAGMMALDIGPETRTLFGARLETARTVFWNGPMGVFEKQPFAAGTMEMARAIAGSGALSVVGGGDSVAAVNDSGVADRISHISTGGGASLEFVQGKTLPGLAALEA